MAGKQGDGIRALAGYIVSILRENVNKNSGRAVKFQGLPPSDLLPPTKLCVLMATHLSKHCYWLRTKCSDIWAYESSSHSFHNRIFEEGETQGQFSKQDVSSTTLI